MYCFLHFTPIKMEAIRIIGVLPCVKEKVPRRDKEERQIDTARQGIARNRLIGHHQHSAALQSWLTNLWNEFLNLLHRPGSSRPKLGKSLQNVLPIHLHHRQGSQREGWEGWFRPGFQVITCFILCAIDNQQKINNL